jgi:hypothetical protein
VLLDFFAGHYRPSALCQKQEHAEWLRLEFYQDASFAEFACRHIQLKRAEANAGRLGWIREQWLLASVDTLAFYQLRHKPSSKTLANR